MTDESKQEKPKTVKVRFIDDGDDETEEAALEGLKEGVKGFLSPEGQEKIKQYWKQKKEKTPEK